MTGPEPGVLPITPPPKAGQGYVRRWPIGNLRVVALGDPTSVPKTNPDRRTAGSQADVRRGRAGTRGRSRTGRCAPVRSRSVRRRRTIRVHQPSTSSVTNVKITPSVASTASRWHVPRNAPSATAKMWQVPWSTTSSRPRTPFVERPASFEISRREERDLRVGDHATVGAGPIQSVNGRLTSEGFERLEEGRTDRGT